MKFSQSIALTTSVTDTCRFTVRERNKMKNERDKATLNAMAPLRLMSARLFNTTLPSYSSSSSSSPPILFRSSLSLFSVLLPMDNTNASPPGTEAFHKEACDSDPANKRFADRLIPHILRLYGSSATSHDFEIYAPDASFEDPLMCARGVKQIKSAFYSLPKVFSESKIVEYNVEENMVSPGKGEILIDNKQHYKFLGKDIDMVSLIRLYVEEGKVVRHEDWWDKKPISNRETVKLPVLGRAAEITRRGSMLVTHLLMGFGKDPTV